MNHQIPLSSAWQPLKGPFTRWPRATDAVLAILVALASMFLSSEHPNQDLVIRAVSDIPIVAFILTAVAGGVLYWRRSHPLEVLAVTLVALLVSTGLGYSYDFFGMLVALYSIGRYENNDRWSQLGVAGATVLVGLSLVFESTGTLADFGSSFVVLFVVWYIGRRIRIRGEYLRLLQERAVRLEREQANEARRAVAEERTRIARELHDVVAHRVSLMTVQAGAAKTVAVDNPEGALRAMEAVEAAGRQALDEMRHLMGILRPEAEADRLGPQPGFSDVPRLIENFKETGLNATLTMDVEQIDVPARVELSVFRVVQEALTNVLKHAGPSAQTEVRVNIENQGVAIEVLDNGYGATILPGSGHGIAGMRERAQLLGGRFYAGPRQGGGFKVVAYLPVEDETI